MAGVSDWSEHLAPDGKTYYYNKATKVSQWNRPADFAPLPPGQGGASQTAGGATGANGAVAGASKLADAGELGSDEWVRGLHLNTPVGNGGGYGNQGGQGQGVGGVVVGGGYGGVGSGGFNGAGAYGQYGVGGAGVGRVGAGQDVRTQGQGQAGVS